MQFVQISIAYFTVRFELKREQNLTVSCIDGSFVIIEKEKM